MPIAPHSLTPCIKSHYFLRLVQSFMILQTAVQSSGIFPAFILLNLFLKHHISLSHWSNTPPTLSIAFFSARCFFICMNTSLNCSCCQSISCSSCTQKLVNSHMNAYQNENGKYKDFSHQLSHTIGDSELLHVTCHGKVFASDFDCVQHTSLQAQHIAEHQISSSLIHALRFIIFDFHQGNILLSIFCSIQDSCPKHVTYSCLLVSCQFFINYFCSTVSFCIISNPHSALCAVLY